jgi:hypothetical protein
VGSTGRSRTTRSVALPGPLLAEPPPSRRPVVRSQDPDAVRWRAVRIDHLSDGWKIARLKWEIEDWGEPTAYLVGRRSVHLSCDPPISLFSTTTPESTLGEQGASGAWLDLPDDVDNVADAAAWVRCARTSERAARHRRRRGLD